MTEALVVDPKTEHVLDVYRKTADIYRRINLALGRVQQYSVSVGSTMQAIRIDARQTTIQNRR
jgi:hypothetical protein